jgi:hypothetical protein
MSETQTHVVATCKIASRLADGNLETETFLYARKVEGDCNPEDVVHEEAKEWFSVGTRTVKRASRYEMDAEEWHEAIEFGDVREVTPEIYRELTGEGE